MFSDEQHIEGKVFLKSFNDALSCLRESAQTEQNEKFQSFVAQRIIDAQINQTILIKSNQIKEGKGFSSSREVKLFQFSNFVFQKYLGGLETYKGSYHGLQKIMTNGIKNLQAEIGAKDQ